MGIVFLAVVTLAILPCRGYVADKMGDEVLKLYIGEPKILPVSSPSRVAIANPDIIDVANVTKSEITISPKAPGTTSLVFWDIFGEQAYTVKVFKEDINNVKLRVDNMLQKLNLPDVYTQAEEEEGKVILLGRVKTPQERERISLVLGSLKDKTLDLLEVKEESTVIEIDVQVLELQKGATDTLGFTWPGGVNILEVGSPGIASAATSWGKLFKLSKVERATTAGTADPYTLKLDALIQEGKARILSRPRLACQSGKEAKLIVGGEVPVFTATQSASGVTGSVAYKEYGIILNIKPRVDEFRRIHLNLGIEVSEVGTAESTSYARAYPLTKRNAYTELFLDNGQTMAIGGLIKQKTEEELRKFPWLSDVPVLGAFFRQRTTRKGGGFGTKGDTELFITLTPKIVSEQKETIREKRVAPKVVAPVMPVTSNVPESIAGYAGVIQKRILDSLNYPALAKEAGFQGTTKLSLLLSYRGELLDIKVKSSSGHKILDDNALQAAKGIDMYPPFPSSVGEKELWIDIPIAYRLD